MIFQNKISKFLAITLIFGATAIYSTTSSVPVSVSDSSSARGLSWTDRPKDVVDAIDEAFSAVSKMSDETISEENEKEKSKVAEIAATTGRPPEDAKPIEGYFYNGMKPYAFFLDTRKIAWDIIEKSDRDTINMIDIGCGKGVQAGIIADYVLGRIVSEMVENKKTGKALTLRKPKEIHIFNVTGESFTPKAFPPLISQSLKDCPYKFFIHNIPQFKIENFTDELLRIKFDISNPNNRFDFVYSDLALTHIVDFPGTFKQICDVIRLGGYMLSGGGCFWHEMSSIGEKTLCIDRFLEISRLKMLSLLKTTGYPYAFISHDITLDEPGQFILGKTNDDPLSIPLEYAGIQERPQPTPGVKVTAPRPKTTATFIGSLKSAQELEEYPDELIIVGNEESLREKLMNWSWDSLDRETGHDTNIRKFLCPYTELITHGVTEYEDEGNYVVRIPQRRPHR